MSKKIKNKVPIEPYDTKKHGPPLLGEVKDSHGNDYTKLNPHWLLGILSKPQN
jgi:hypothetical protein